MAANTQVMNNLKWKIFNWLFEWFQKRCPHDPSYVSADILEGSYPDCAVKWCQRCGAHRVNYSAAVGGNGGDMREPRATWVDKPKHPISWKEWQAAR